jgi:aldehyde:ferredoxin oxidoreductase
MKYYTMALAEGAANKIDSIDDSAIGEEVARGLVTKRSGGCFACPQSCLIGWQFADGSIPGGAGCCNENKFCLKVEQDYYGGKYVGRALIEAVRLHDDLGLSETQTGFKYEYEWFRHLVTIGVLTETNTGLPLDRMGSREFWQAYLHQIAAREGIGALLAEGEERFFAGLLATVPDDKREAVEAIRDQWLYKSGCGYYGHWGGGRLSGALGALEQATNVRTNLQIMGTFFNPNLKNCYLPADECKELARAGALRYFGTEKVLDRHSFEAKIPAAITLQDISFVSDSVNYCRWVYPKAYSGYTPDHLGDISIGSRVFSAVTDIPMSERSMLRAVGEKGTNLERMILVREGRRRRNDTFNEDLFARNGHWLSREAFDKAMDEYYRARGWDLETGIPMPEKLAELGLSFCNDYRGR